MKRTIFLLLTLFFIITVNGQGIRCLLYKQEALFIKHLIIDTLVVMDDVRKYNLKTIKTFFIEDINKNDSIDVSLFKDYHLSNDTILNCNFGVSDIIIRDGSRLIEECFNEDNPKAMPPNVTFSNILFVDNQYAYFTMTAQNLNPGHFARWVIYKKDENTDEWHLLKSEFINIL
jgi:hypothetical protein